MYQEQTSTGQEKQTVQKKKSLSLTSTNASENTGKSI